MNLGQLRKQAKELVRAARAGDAQALERLGGREPILARAQLVLAREHGYSSWPAIVARLEATADAFVDSSREAHATGRRCCTCATRASPQLSSRATFSNAAPTRT